MKLTMSLSSVAIFIILELLAITTIIDNISFCNGTTSMGCIESEREALLSFKQHIHYEHAHRVASWIPDGDCCNWAGIVCDNLTGHVLELNLENDFDFDGYRNPWLRGNITTSLLGLKHLVLLNLSGNYFDHEFPTFLGSMRSLRYLDLSYNRLFGMVPCQLGNISHLQYLDLAQYSSQDLYVENLQWLYNLSLLEHLDLSGVNLSKASDWLSITNSLLPSLEFLRLSSCELHSPFLPMWIFGLSRLNYLDLSSNYFEGQIPEKLQNLTSLKHLDLFSNSLKSTIPNKLYRLSNLEYLSLSYNQIEDKIPRSFGKLCHLRTIDLSNANLRQEISEIIDIFSTCASNSLDTISLSNTSLFGPVPLSLGEFSSLSILDLSHNKLNGTLSQGHFLNLRRLTGLLLHTNSLTLKLHRDWIPPFQLKALVLSSCSMGPEFPRWLHSQKKLEDLVMANCSIFDSIPNWFWRTISKYAFVDLSNNQIYGEIPNNMSGALPLMSSTLKVLDISNNSLSGSIIHFLCSTMNVTRLDTLNLRSNNFSGEVPDCWMNFQNLWVLNLAANKLSGKLPVSLGSLSFLRSLHLNQNHLSGIIPISLQNCSELQILDISENKFAQNVPAWIGEKLTEIRILNLRSNKLDGFLPVELCRLEYLQILDLSDNNLCGRLPNCISNFSAMVTKSDDSSGTINMQGYYFDEPQFESESLVTNGKMNEYGTILNLVRKMDLSKNNFSGEIPIKVTRLVALQWLNLSHNSLTGKMPENIGAMTSIMEIDFSCNHLSGEIPQSISELTFLKNLNLSNNNFVGKIPISTQLQTFDPSSFSGNELCGAPLLECIETVSTSENEKKGRKNEDGMLWFYVSMVFGFVVGFWGFIGPLVVNRGWRYRYYGYLDFVGYKIRDVARKCF